MKEDVETLKNDWLTDNVRGCPFIIHSVTDRSFLEYILLGRVCSIPGICNEAPCTCLHVLRYQPEAHRWTRYLEREYLNQHKSANIVLLRPSMSFMLMQTPDPLTLKEALPKLSRTTHIFLPINDCRNPSVAEGGSHWSLLLVSILDRVAFHYDSLNPANIGEAQHAAMKLGQLLGKQLHFINLADSPQQMNSSDCGVFVCIQMRYLLLKKLLMSSAKEKVSMSMGGKDVDAVSGRKEMLRIIEGYRKEGEKRRS